MEERYIATVDLGTSKIALTVAKVTGQDMQILFYRERPSAGIRYGSVFNPSLASASLSALVAEAESELSIKIMQAVVGLPRFGVQQETASAAVARPSDSSCISREEVDNVKEMALDSYPLDNPDTEIIYGAEAQSFSTEDQMSCSEEEIVGIPSSTLEGNFKVFVGPSRPVSNLDKMLNLSGIALARKVFLPGATAEATLSREERDNGVALIEMGAGVTSVTIYQRGILRYYGAIPFGGQSISSDIKYECGFSAQLAENVKLAFGACRPDKLQNMSDKILQIENHDDGTDQQLPVKYLSEIIHARCSEILEAILFLIQESGYADRLRNGVVLTGGGALLTGCAALLKDLSGYNVRIGFPRTQHFSWSGCPGIGEPSAVSSVALLLASKDDAHLNCTTAPEPEEDGEEPAAEAPEADAPAQEGGQEPAETPSEPVDPDGTVFDPNAFGKKEKVKKEKKPHKQLPPVNWIKEKVKVISGTLDGFYKEMN